MTYDPVKDFAPIALLASAPNLLYVHPAVPARTVRELIEHAKKNPGVLSAASAGSGTSSHLSLAIFKSMTGTDIIHVPYKGPAPALQAVLSGEVSFVFDTLTSGLPHVKAGRLRALGITVPQRSALVPEIPTLDEIGLAGFDVGPWFALFAPTGTPQVVVSQLHAETEKILSSREMRERLEAQGLRIHVRPPAELKHWWRAKYRAGRKLSAMLASRRSKRVPAFLPTTKEMARARDETGGIVRLGNPGNLCIRPYALAHRLRSEQALLLPY